MRKIKAKSFKPPRRFKPDKANVDFVYCYPIEGALFNLRQCEEQAWKSAKERMWARLRGQPVEPEENYIGGNWREQTY